MKYHSTHSRNTAVSLSEAVVQGVAPDGGLFMPEQLPVIPRAFFNNIAGMTLNEVSYVVAQMFFGNDIAPDMLKSLIDRTLSFDIPLVATDHDDIFSLQMFHGPGGTSKDIGVRFMAHLTAYYRAVHPESDLSIITATDGDIGDAIAGSFHDLHNITVYLLYPHGRAPRHDHPLLSDPAGRVVPIEVDGNLDQCQDMIRTAFADPDVTSTHKLTSVNSVNIARIVAQIFPFFHAYARLAAQRQPGDTRLPEPVFAIPCGNLGNLVAGVMAKRMGLPIKRFLAVDCATSPSRPANTERLLHLYNLPADCDSQTARQHLAHEITFVHSDAPSPGQEYPALKELKRNLQPGEQGVYLEATMSARACQIIDSPHRRQPARIQRRVARIPATFPALRRILLRS